MDNKTNEVIDVLENLQSSMRNATCYLRDIGRADKEEELRGAANIVGEWICLIWDESRSPRNAQQSDVKINSHPIECDDVVDKSGFVVAKHG